MSLCYKTSNNKYFNCPPRMDDGRHFTDYRPNCHLNNLMATQNSNLNSFEYRQFLTHNAVNLMNQNRKYNSEKNSCGPCMNPYNQGTMLNENTMKKCGKKTCNTTVFDEDGLGQGRDYNDNNRSCGDWPEVPNSVNYSCCAESNDLFNYYNHVDTKAQGELLPRLTMPLGGKAFQGGDPQPFNL